MSTVKLNQNQLRVLFKIFENERSKRPLSFKKLRVDLFEQLHDLDYLENNGYVVNNSDQYELKIEALHSIISYDPSVELALHRIESIFQILRESYRDNPDSSLILLDVEIKLGISRKELNRLVVYLLDLPIISGRSLDLNEENASITPSESILKYKSVYDVIETVKSWKKPPEQFASFQPIESQQIELDDFSFLLHPRIIDTSLSLFRSGHLREAVLNSMTAIFDAIRQRTQLTDDDGDRLIGKVFSLDSPHLIFSELDTESGRSDQKGFIQIFKGAYQGIRNPNAHTLDHALTERMAAQYLILASLMIQRVEDSKSAIR